jgi:hypothetical protein
MLRSDKLVRQPLPCHLLFDAYLVHRQVPFSINTHPPLQQQLSDILSGSSVSLQDWRGTTASNIGASWACYSFTTTTDAASSAYQRSGVHKMAAASQPAWPAGGLASFDLHKLPWQPQHPGYSLQRKSSYL